MRSVTRDAWRPLRSSFLRHRTALDFQEGDEVPHELASAPAAEAWEHPVRTWVDPQASAAQWRTLRRAGWQQSVLEGSRSRAKKTPVSPETKTREPEHLPWCNPPMLPVLPCVLVRPWCAPVAASKRPPAGEEPCLPPRSTAHSESCMPWMAYAPEPSA